MYTNGIPTSEWGIKGYYEHSSRNNPPSPFPPVVTNLFYTNKGPAHPTRGYRGSCTRLLKFCCAPHSDSSTENYYYKDDILSEGHYTKLVPDYYCLIPTAPRLASYRSRTTLHTSFIMDQQPRNTLSARCDNIQTHDHHDNQQKACDINQTQHPPAYHDTDSKVPSPTHGQLDFTSVMSRTRFGKDGLWRKCEKRINIRRSYVRKGFCTLRRIKGLLFSLCSLFWPSIRHSLFSSFYLLYPEYQSLVSLLFIGFIFLSPYLFVSIKVFGSPTVSDHGQKWQPDVPRPQFTN